MQLNNIRIKLKNDTLANWNLNPDFIPLQGELIVYNDLQKMKIGDGITTIIALPFFGETYVDQKIDELINGEEVQY